MYNQGIDYLSSSQYWKYDFKRTETLEIILHGNGEFYAENIHFKGSYHIEVPNNNRMIAYEQDNTVLFHTELIDQASWNWQYTFRKNYDVRLKKINY